MSSRNNWCLQCSTSKASLPTPPFITVIAACPDSCQVPEFAEHVLAYLVRLELMVEQHNPDQVGSMIKHPILDAVDLVALQVGVLDV